MACVGQRGWQRNKRNNGCILGGDRQREIAPMPHNTRQRPSHDQEETAEGQEQQLARRVGRLHLAQRLGLERDQEDQVVGRGRNWFHIENWTTAHALIRNTLRLTGLYRRGQRNVMDFEVRRNALVLPRLPTVFEGFTLLQLSDLHVDAHVDFPAALAARIERLDYDLCVLTGDYRFHTYGPMDAALAGLHQIREAIRGPVYGILGNHDSIRMLPALETMGIRMLMNEAVALQREGAALWLAGIDDPHYYRADNLEKASDAIPLEATSILLAHSPEIYRNAAHAGFDAMLCGHTHGGQICLPGGYPIYCNAAAPRRVSRGGPWRQHQMQGYTSRGTGSSVVDARFHCRPEITLHRLHCAPATTTK